MDRDVMYVIPIHDKNRLLSSLLTNMLAIHTGIVRVLMEERSFVSLNRAASSGDGIPCSRASHSYSRFEILHIHLRANCVRMKREEFPFRSLALARTHTHTRARHTYYMAWAWPRKSKLYAIIIFPESISEKDKICNCHWIMNGVVLYIISSAFISRFFSFAAGFPSRASSNCSATLPRAVERVHFDGMVYYANMPNVNMCAPPIWHFECVQMREERKKHTATAAMRVDKA